MSIEFRAKLPRGTGEEDRKAILEEIARDPGWNVVGRNESGLLLRFPNSRPNDSWPEDIDLRLDGGKVDVAFYTGTRQQRNEALSRLAAILGSHGIESEFEEL